MAIPAAHGEAEGPSKSPRSYKGASIGNGSPQGNKCGCHSSSSRRHVATSVLKLILFRRCGCSRIVGSTGARFLTLGHDENLDISFGDPATGLIPHDKKLAVYFDVCVIGPGMRKDLVIDYELMGVGGDNSVEEMHSHPLETFR